mmetsp:Transcript_67416/g.119529  ORF Transcript_67416/g.119529 Transcript_67416/m.119529 type:complete len:140 (+) Transcript_67416:1107-1526(+)
MAVGRASVGLKWLRDFLKVVIVLTILRADRADGQWIPWMSDNATWNVHPQTLVCSVLALHLCILGGWGGSYPPQPHLPQPLCFTRSKTHPSRLGNTSLQVGDSIAACLPPNPPKKLLLCTSVQGRSCPGVLEVLGGGLV